MSSFLAHRVNAAATTGDTCEWLNAATMCMRLTTTVLSWTSGWLQYTHTHARSCCLVI